MSKDDNLVVSCKCGCTTIETRGGYFTQELPDIAELGLAATTLCRRKRYRRVLWRWLIVAALVGVVGTAWVDGLNRARTEEAGRLCREGEQRMNVIKDDVGAIELFTRSLAIRQEPRIYLFRGFCHWRLSNFTAALADTEAALALDPANEAALKNRQMARDALGKAGREGSAGAGGSTRP